MKKIISLVLSLLCVGSQDMFASEAGGNDEHKNKNRVAAHLFGIGAGVLAAKALQFAPRHEKVNPKAVMAVGAVATYAVVTPTVAWYLRIDDDYGTKYKAPEVTQENKKRLSWKSVVGSIALLGGTGLGGYGVAKYCNCNQNQTVAATLAGPATLLAAAGYVHAKKHRAAREQAERDGRIYGNPNYDPRKN